MPCFRCAEAERSSQGELLDGLNYHGCPNHDGLNCTWTWAKNVTGDRAVDRTDHKNSVSERHLRNERRDLLALGGGVYWSLQQLQQWIQWHYGVQASSPYHNAASDGKDIGADIVYTADHDSRDVWAATAFPALTITTPGLPDGRAAPPIRRTGCERRSVSVQVLDRQLRLAADRIDFESSRADFGHTDCRGGPMHSRLRCWMEDANRHAGIFDQHQLTVQTIQLVDYNLAQKCGRLGGRVLWRVICGLLRIIGT